VGDARGAYPAAGCACGAALRDGRRTDGTVTDGDAGLDAAGKTTILYRLKLNE